MAFRQFLTIGAKDQRNVRVDRQRPAHRGIDQHLTRRVVEVVVAADHVGDAHIVVIDHNGEHVGRCSVRTQNDHIVELVVANGHVALDLIVDHGGALKRSLHTDHIGQVRVGGRISVTPWAAVEGRFALGLGRIAEGLNFVLGREAFVGVTRG